MRSFINRKKHNRFLCKWEEEQALKNQSKIACHMRNDMI